MGVDQKWPALAGILNHFAWDFPLTRDGLSWHGFWIVCFVESFVDPNDLSWQGFWVMCCVRYVVDQERCFGSCCCIICCVRFFVGHKRRALAWTFWIICCVRCFVLPGTTCLGRDFESYVAWGFLLTRSHLPRQGYLSLMSCEVSLTGNDLPWQGYWILCCVRFFVFQEWPVLERCMNRMLREDFSFARSVLLW